MKTYKPTHGDTIYFWDYTEYEEIRHHFVDTYGKMMLMECSGKETCPLCKQASNLIKSDDTLTQRIGMKLWAKPKYKFQITTDITDSENTLEDYLMSKTIFTALSTLLLDEKMCKYLCQTEPLALRFFITDKNHYPCYDYSCFLVGDARHKLPIGYLHSINGYYRNIKLKDAVSYLSQGGHIFKDEFVFRT